MAQKSVMYEHATRVPLLVRVPGETDGGIRVPAPVSLVDLVPTLLDLLGERTSVRLHGESLVPMIVGESSNGRDVFVEWNGDDGEKKWFSAPGFPAEKARIEAVYGSAMRAVVTPDLWKLSLTEAGETELYDLSADPLETVNLAGSSTARSRENNLRHRILEWQRRTGDTVVLL